MDETFEHQKLAIQVVRKPNHRVVGVAILRRLQDPENGCLMTISLFQFMDNEQYSNLDSLMVSLGSSEIVLCDDLEDPSKADNRRIHNIFKSNEISYTFTKRTFFKSENLIGSAQKLCGDEYLPCKLNHTQYNLAYGCIECLIQKWKLLNDEEMYGKYSITLESLDSFMRLDSAASEAVNLLPNPSHPSKYGSLFGVMNRCKTKLGQKLLERWLRQPLVDEIEINARLDIVQIFRDSAVTRNQLLEGPLQNVPNLEQIICRIERKTAGLGDLYRLYLFAKTIPTHIGILEDFLRLQRGSAPDAAGSVGPSGSSGEVLALPLLETRFLHPLEKLSNKFANYIKLTEHVIDMSQLPDLLVSADHDPRLQDLREDMDEMQENAEKILKDARSSWASFADVKLEMDSQHGYFLRTTRGDDERQLRANNSKVQIIGIQKNGVHFTVPALRSISERFKTAESTYKSVQLEVVRKAVETAATYAPVVEAACSVIGELDVLLSFATLAALSPEPYVRPTILSKGTGVLRLEQARHPCVELMEDMRFIANDYDLVRGDSGFQIITGPNMGGKSTYIRAVGCISVMAQVGCFVPCTSAEISVVDCILARVGAGDAVQKGVSTFMAEMLEASVILRTATKASLIIIDELGRGTSTFDGFGLAWAISEYIVDKIDCLCVFATHFHELTALALQYKGVKNKHVTAQTTDKSVLMTYTVQEGPCTQSFGIHVARIAGFPPKVLSEAKRKADQLEQEGEGVEEADAERKHRKMQAALTEFGNLPVNALPADEVRSHLSRLFPSHDIVV